MEYKIEKGIPLPPMRNKHPGATSKLKLMDVGDSIFFPEIKQKDLGARLHRLRKEGWKMKTRTVEGGIRVWRVE